ncbi:speckle-type POZ protein B [Trichonephila clavata]|uniref:Speckle-type POZ protein B n=1 Tax=Trichonephila clavata TaxID=2740835 RepID=A0A8X6M264_TRICU|nr:speckle-type POZ protein B [Trichonephila clavata]
MNVNEEARLLSSENVSLSEYKENAECLDPIDFFIVTRVPVKTYRFKWILNQFNNISINKEVNSCFYSSYYRLKLIKYENGFGLFHVLDTEKQTERTSKSDEKWVLNNSRSAQEYFIHHVIECKVAVVDKHGKEIMKFTTCISNDKYHGSFTIGEYRSNSWKTFFDDVLVLDCCIKVTKKPETEKQFLNTEYSLQCRCWERLSQDLKSMYLNSLSADYTLKVGTEEIQVNSFILAARSSVFKKMFHHDKEQHATMIITDVPLPAMKRLVEFLYTGAVEEAAKRHSFPGSVRPLLCGR